MRVAFRKMHGLGNDFVVLDARERSLPPVTPAIAAALADRNTGIGCDQLILLEPSGTAPFRMRIFNPDGGEVEACGNAARSVALLHGEAVEVETKGGRIALEPFGDGARVDMGRPRFDWRDIPLAEEADTLALPAKWDGLPSPVAINVGNPHVVFIVDTLNEVPVSELGPAIETDPLFPERINVNFAQVTGPQAIDLVVWERGAGLTRACGTGACATAVAAIRRGLVSSPVTVTLPGGALRIEWSEGEPIVMSGPAAEAFRGEFEWDDYV